MRIERAVVGIDFSDAAHTALQWAGRVLEGSTEYVLVHAVDIPHPPTFLAGRLPHHDELVETARAGALTRLRQLSLELPGTPRLEVRVGRPARQIAAVAEEMKADLVIVGEHGKRRGLWKLLGSTAEQLIHTVSVPVVVARNVTDAGSGAILAPVDEAPAPALALRWAAHLAERSGARIVALHVLDPAITGRIGLVSTYAAAREFECELLTNTRQWIESQVMAAGVRREIVDAVVSVGSASYEILAAAERHEAQLIVIASRGAGPTRQRVLGSVAHAVLKGAACSVLILGTDA